MEGNEFSQFRAPEGTYVCTDWSNPIVNRNATQHGGNALASNAPGIHLTLSAPRTAGCTEPPRTSAVSLRAPNTRARLDHDTPGFPLDPALAAQGLDANPADIAEIGAEGEPAQEHGAHFAGLHRAMGTLSARPNRPKTSLKGSNSVFIMRANVHTDLGKILGQRTESVTITVVTASKSLVWFANIGGKIREPLARVTFSSTPTCHDINQFTRCGERLDVVVGFAHGDILWVDPVTMRYNRINKGGALNGSIVRQVRWLPRSENLFLTAHADGAIIVFDREREDATNCAHLPEPPTDWDPRESMFVSRPPGGMAEEQAANGWRMSKPKEVPWSSLNPVSYWCVSRKAVTDIAFSPDSTQAAITSDDGLLRIVDVDSETLVRSFSSYFGGFNCVCWSPDGRLLLTGGQDDLLTLWAPHEGRIIARAQGHKSFITAIAFDPWHGRGSEDAYRLVSVGEDCCLALWDFSPAALQRPKAYTRNTATIRGDRTSFPSASQGRSTVHIPAPARAEVATIEPTTLAPIPGTMLSSVRVAPSGFLLLHYDGQLDWLARPKPNHVPLATDLDAAQLATSDGDESFEAKSPTRGISRAFGLGLPSLRRKASQSMSGTVAS